jgi:phosphonate transport system substrate-binding protein
MYFRFKSILNYSASLILLILVGILTTGCDTAKDRPKMRIGYMNCNSEAETKARFGPLNEYLSQQLDIDFELVSVDTQEFSERFKQGEFDFTHSNSLLYIILREEENLRLLATEMRGQYGPRTAGTIISKKGSGIKTLADLKDKYLLFGPQLAPSGFLAQYDLMLQAGLNPEQDLAYYGIPRGSFKHEKVVYGVYFDKYDVAAAPALDLELMIRDGKITADDFNIVAQSEIFPYCTFGAAQEIPESLAERFRSVLLDLTAGTTVLFQGETVKVLDSAWIDGFEKLDDADYDPIRRMAKNANMPPYQEF